MKKALFYAIRRSVYRSQRVVAVTTLKGDRWYGRGCDYDNTTNGTLSDLLPGRYATQVEALKVVEALTDIADKYKRRRDELHLQLAALHRDEENEIKLFLKGVGHEMV